MAELRENISPDSFDNVWRKTVQYNIQGTCNLGTSQTTELEWKDYCPEAFRNIQEVDQVSQADYSMVLCANEILKEVTSPSKPGRIFFVSTDGRLVVKTLRKVELKGILDMFRSYYFHLSNNPSTLLLRLYGLHAVRQCGGIKVYFLVFGGALPPEVKATDCYHLKGISTGRKKESLKVEDYILQKDFDFDYRFYLHPEIRQKLFAQLKSDCAYLEADGRMDYSIAMAIAVSGSRDRSSTVRKSPHTKSSMSSSPSSSKSSSCISADGDWSSPELGDKPLRFSDITEYLDSINKSRISIGMPARAVRKKKIETRCSKEPECFNVVLYFIITDIFQKYNVKKKIEHVYKTIQHDTKFVSTVNPKEYCSRFLEFAEQIFLQED